MVLFQAPRRFPAGDHPEPLTVQGAEERTSSRCVSAAWGATGICKITRFPRHGVFTDSQMAWSGFEVCDS